MVANITFGAEITGDTAQAVERHAADLGVTPAKALADLLRNAIWFSGLVSSDQAERDVTCADEDGTCPDCGSVLDEDAEGDTHCLNGCENV